MATDMTVASTILEQLGGSRFVAMTGARNFLGAPTYLAFHLPANGDIRNRRLVEVHLLPSDTYKIVVQQFRGLQMIVQAVKAEDVYAEDLQRVFTSLTGLDTKL